MSVFLIILGTLLALDVAWGFLSRRWLRRSVFWRTVVSAFLLLQFASFSYIIAGRLVGARWNLPTSVMTSLYLWHLLVLPAAFAGALAILIFLIVRWPFVRKNPLPSAEIESTRQTRRQFLITAATVTPPLVNLALTGFSQKQIEQFRVREMTLAIPGLPRDLHGVTLCHVTDLHVGPFTSEQVIKRVAETINSLRADLVLFTGDLINSKLSELPQGVDFIRSIEARHGVAVVEGNHDLFEGRAAFESAFRAAGLRLLVNETESLIVRGQPVELLGLRWGGHGEKTRASSDAIIGQSLADLLAQRVGGDHFPILLAHHPHAFDPAAASGIPLTLAGHTHGGQLMLNPEVGAGPLMFRYWSGRYQRGQSQLVVGNGVGNWFPLRTAAPAEVIRLTLTRAG